MSEAPNEAAPKQNTAAKPAQEAIKPAAEKPQTAKPEAAKPAAKAEQKSAEASDSGTASAPKAEFTASPSTEARASNDPRVRRRMEAAAAQKKTAGEQGSS